MSATGGPEHSACRVSRRVRTGNRYNAAKVARIGANEERIDLTRAQRLITFSMNVLVAIAIIEAIRVVVAYFGVLSGTSVGELYLRASTVLVFPLGFPAVRSLYGGTFDVNAAMTVIICLVLEWILSIWRTRL
jgi:hypothetical protein